MEALGQIQSFIPHLYSVHDNRVNICLTDDNHDSEGSECGQGLFSDIEPIDTFLPRILQFIDQRWKDDILGPVLDRQVLRIGTIGRRTLSLELF